MTLKDEYYEHLSDKTTIATWQKQILFEIIADLTDRSGLRQEWEQIDDDIQEEIMSDWLEIIEKYSTYA